MNDETYIKMCDCPDVQGQWNRDRDDRFCNYDHVGQHVIVTGYHDEDGDFLRGDHPIWLPYQHQLQEMVSGQFFTYEGSDGAKMPNPAGMIHCFSEFYNERYEYASYETAWLAFAMEELHNKYWDGEAWIGGNDGK